MIELAGCGCGGSAAARREILRTQQNAPTHTGGYLLASYPGCTSLYRGPGANDSAYVVGRNVPEIERLFRRSDLTGATQYAIETKAQIENIPLTALCAEAVLALLA